MELGLILLLQSLICYFTNFGFKIKQTQNHHFFTGLPMKLMTLKKKKIQSSEKTKQKDKLYQVNC